MLRASLVTCLLLLLGACQGGFPPRLDDSADPAQRLTALTLNRAFPVRADYAGEHIQGGEIMPFNSISEYSPYCKLELRQPAPVERVIQPDTFTVSRIYQEMEYVGYAKMLFAGDGSSGLALSRTVYFLQSVQQPEIFRLSCMKLDFSFYAEQPTLEEMQLTLGDLVTLLVE